jgi:hypothetical protein
MKQLKQIVFEVEVKETVVLQSGELTTTGFCPICGETVALAVPWIAATLHGSSERELFRLIERGSIYVIENERIFMCLGCVGRAVTGWVDPPERSEPKLVKPREILKRALKA